MELFFLGLAVLGAGGLGSLAAPERFKSWIMAFSSGIAACCLIGAAYGVIVGAGLLSAVINCAYPVGEVRIVIDRIAAFFIILFSLMNFLCAWYAIGYMKPYYGQGRPVGVHFFFLGMLMVSMVLIVVVQNAIAFLLVWEIMSLSSFFLVAFEHERLEVYRAAINYLIAMQIGALFLFAAFIFAMQKTGSADFASFHKVFSGDAVAARVLFLLFFIGFGTKAGFVPLHSWLPHAHPAAPSHVSALMSGIMIKTGVYGIIRIISLIPRPPVEIGYMVLGISLATALYGIANALAQSNLKRMLAYSSIENIGIIGLGLGIGLLGISHNNNNAAFLGFAGALLHIVNHGIFKSLLFFGAGAIYQQTHELTIDRLGGLAKTMRCTAIFFLFGSVAIIGLPPLNGFISEFLMYIAMLSDIRAGGILYAILMVLSLAGLALVGGMALLCFGRVFGIVFLGMPRVSLHAQPVEVCWSMRAPMLALSLLTAVIGILPDHACSGIAMIVPELSGNAMPALSSARGTLSNLSLLMIFFIGLSAILFGIRYLLLRNRSVSRYKTWDCGYQAGTPRMQYSASSFAEPLLALLKPFVHRVMRPAAPDGLFPVNASLRVRADDTIERTVFFPVIRAIGRLFDRFAWIQSGNTQQYILYGLVFLIAITIWIMAV